MILFKGYCRSIRYGSNWPSDDERTINRTRILYDRLYGIVIVSDVEMSDWNQKGQREKMN